MITAIIFFIVGMFVGAVNAVAGGGMLVGFPVLLAGGLSPIVANASSRLVLLPGAFAATIGYRRALRHLPRRYWWLIVLSMVGAAAGAFILRELPPDGFEQIVPWLVLAAVLAFGLQPVLQRYVRKKAHRRLFLPFAVLSVLLFALAVYAGYFGLGYAFMLLAILSFSSLPNIHHMNAFKTLAGTATAFVALIVLLGSGLFDWQAGLVMGAGNAVGGYVTARRAEHVPAGLIRGIVIATGLLSSIYLFFAM